MSSMVNAQLMLPIIRHTVAGWRLMLGCAGEGQRWS